MDGRKVWGWSLIYISCIFIALRICNKGTGVQIFVLVFSNSRRSGKNNIKVIKPLVMLNAVNTLDRH